MVSAGRTVGAISFTDGTSTTIQSSGGFSLTLNNDGRPSTIEVAGAHTISAPVLLANDAIISGSGVLNLSAGISGPYTLTVAGGTLSTSSIVVDTLIIGGGTAAAVPEPGMLVLTAFGIFGAIAYVWRRRT
jgi:hypothetical protein